MNHLKLHSKFLCLVNKTCSYDDMLQPLEIREAHKEKATRVGCLGVWAPSEEEGKKLEQLASALEQGR